MYILQVFLYTIIDCSYCVFLLLSNPVKCIFNNLVYHVFIDYHTMSVMWFCNLYYSQVSCITVQTCMSFSFIFSASFYGLLIT